MRARQLWRDPWVYTLLILGASASALWASSASWQLLVLVVGAIVALGLWRLPKWSAVSGIPTALERFNIENEARKTLAQILGGAVLVGGLYYTAQTLRTGQENLRISQESLRTSQETLATAQETQRVERFVKAIDMLGSQKVEVRLGGIAVLEGLARGSEHHRKPILLLLAAYVREHARNGGVRGQTSEEPRPREDIQAILRVLGETPRGEMPLDLSNTDLRGADLDGTSLHRIDFRDTDLRSADMRRLKSLARAKLKRAKLERACLEDADLSGADTLTYDQLRSAIIDERTRTPEGLQRPPPAQRPCYAKSR